MRQQIERWTTHYLIQWYGCASTTPPLGNRCDRRKQARTQKELKQLIKQLFRDVSALKKDPSEKVMLLRRKAGEALKRAIGSEFEEADSPLGREFSDGLSRVTDQFLQEAREFDEDLDLNALKQAMRNLWIANSIQWVLGEEIKLTPAIFAYSLLYPYTDNFLDDPSVSAHQKERLNGEFRKRLAGSHNELEGEYGDILSRLVGKIEEQYPREHYPEVYDILLAIHSAQEESLVQSRETWLPYEQDVLGISFRKGGASVLADAYLVKGRLDEDHARFMFGFGVLLQFLDDLEDMEKDMEEGNSTVFSQLNHRYCLDRIANRLLHFSDRVLNGYSGWENSGKAQLKDGIAKSAQNMVIQAVALNPDAFSRAFRKHLESYSFVSFSFLRSFKQKVKRLEKKLYREVQA